MLSLNAWGLWPQSEAKDERMAAILEFLEAGHHDLVFLQEVWMYSDFQKLKRIFPYSTHFGTPNSRLCPQVR